MADAAVAVEEAGTGGAPAVETPAGAPPSGAPTGDGGSRQGTDAGSAAPPPAATPSPPPKDVTAAPQFPWTDLRKTRNERDTLQRQLEERESERARWEQERQAWQAERAGLEERAKNYDTLAAMVDKDPDFAAELEARLRGQASSPRAAAAVATLPPEFTKQFQETMRRVDQMHGAWQQSEQARTEMARQQSLQRVGQQLDERLTNLLAERRYSKDMLPFVRAHVLERVRELGNAEMDEVPYLFGEWYGAIEKAFADRTQSYVKGAQEQAKLPASPGSVGQSPITAAATPGAFDASTKAQLAEALRQRGWTG